MLPPRQPTKPLIMDPKYSFTSRYLFLPFPEGSFTSVSASTRLRPWRLAIKLKRPSYAEGKVAVMLPSLVTAAKRTTESSGWDVTLEVISDCLVTWEMAKNPLCSLAVGVELSRSEMVVVIGVWLLTMQS